MAVAKKTRLSMKQEDLKILNDAVKLTIQAVQHGTRSYSAEEFVAIQKVLTHSCVTLNSRFATASPDPVDSAPMEAIVNMEGVISAVSSVGSVHEKMPCSPAHCSLVGINKKFSIFLLPAFDEP